MFPSPAELAGKYRQRAEMYRELASIARDPEMRVTFLQAVAAYERAAATEDLRAAEDRYSAVRP